MMPSVVTTATNATPIVITTSGAHGFSSGNAISITGVVGNTAANGVWIITVVDATHFILIGSVGNGEYLSEGSPLATLSSATTSKDITDATNAAPIVVTTSTSHGMSDGAQATIASVGGNTAANGVWFATVLTATTFSLDGSEGSSAYTSGGTATFINYPGIAPAITESATFIKETTTTTGVGDISLGGAVSAFAPFATLVVDSSIQYRIAAVDGDGVETGPYEIGYGTYLRSTNTVSRDEITLTSAEVTDMFPAVLSLSAGTKHIEAVAFREPIPPSDDGGIAGAGAGAIPTAVLLTSMKCRLQVVASITTNDVGRLGSGSTITLAPLPDPLRHDATGARVPGSIALFQRRQTSADGVAVPTYYSAWRLFPVRNRFGDIVTLTQCALNVPSTHPFDVDADFAVSQATTIARVPADIFAWVRTGWTFERSGQVVEIFYLNWYSSTARNQVVDGQVHGHGVVDKSGTLVLDLRGVDFGGATKWVTGFRPGIGDEGTLALLATGSSRFLYLGTVCGLQANGTADMLVRKRLIWNLYNRIAYTDTKQSDAVAGARNWWEGDSYGLVCRMNSALGQYDPTWSHWYVDGGMDASKRPKMSMAASSHGSVAASIRSDMGVMEHTDGTGLSQEALPGVGSISYRRSVLAESMVRAGDTAIGFHWMGATQAGHSSSDRAIATSCRFYKTGAPLTSPDDGAIFAVETTAGPARSVVTGEC